MRGTSQKFPKKEAFVETEAGWILKPSRLGGPPSPVEN